jgi:DNA-binding transcriptional regulator YiaG
MAKKRAEIFRELQDSLRDALAYERGEQVNLRVVELPPAPQKLRPQDIRAIRQDLNASQLIFAAYLNVSANTIRSWEQGTRRPQGADLKLLEIARKNPQARLMA